MSISVEPLAFIVSLKDDRGGMQLPIVGPSFSIGRDSTNNLCVMDDAAVSRQHCVIHVVGSSLMIEDTSRNGTFLDNERVVGVAPLPIPSIVLVGHTALSIIPNESEPEENVTSVIDTSHLDPSSIFVPQTSMLKMRTDAYMVVDVVNSTKIVQSDGANFAKLTLAMGRTLERSLKGETEPFLKCTGDGFFACFGTAAAALRAGIQLAPTLAQQVDVRVQLSVALHWGPSNLTEHKDRIGSNVHAVFSLEQVRHQEQTLEEEMKSGGTTELLLMTEAFWEELGPTDQALARPLGTYPLKGLDEGVRIYRWYGEPE